MIICAYFGYYMSPGYITETVNKLTGGNTDHSMTSSFLAQMGIPSVDEMVEIAKYSFLGIGVAGLGLIIFGAVIKNYKKQFFVQSLDEESLESSEAPSMSKALWVLQERLAKGEITSRQFKNLKRLLDEQN